MINLFARIHCPLVFLFYKILCNVFFYSFFFNKIIVSPFYIIRL